MTSFSSQVKIFTARYFLRSQLLKVLFLFPLVSQEQLVLLTTHCVIYPTRCWHLPHRFPTYPYLANDNLAPFPSSSYWRWFQALEAR